MFTNEYCQSYFQEMILNESLAESPNFGMTDIKDE